MQSVYSIAVLGGNRIIFSCYDEAETDARFAERSHPKWWSLRPRSICIVRTDRPAEVIVRRTVPSDSTNYRFLVCEDGDTYATHCDVWHHADKITGRVEIWRNNQCERAYAVPMTAACVPFHGNMRVLGSFADRLVFNDAMGALMVFE